jgi:hypothetical protein
VPRGGLQLSCMCRRPTRRASARQAPRKSVQISTPVPSPSTAHPSAYPYHCGCSFHDGRLQLIRSGFVYMKRLISDMFLFGAVPAHGVVTRAGRLSRSGRRPTLHLHEASRSSLGCTTAEKLNHLSLRLISLRLRLPRRDRLPARIVTICGHPRNEDWRLGF